MICTKIPNPVINLGPIRARECSVSQGNILFSDIVFRNKNITSQLFKRPNPAKKIVINRTIHRLFRISHIKPIVLGCVILVIAYSAAVKVSVVDHYDRLQALGKDVYQNIEEGITDFKHFNFKAGKEHLTVAQSSLNALEILLNKASAAKILYAPPFSLVDELRAMLATSLTIADDMNSLLNSSVTNAFGAGINIQTIKNIDTKLITISHATPKIITNLADLSVLPGMKDWSQSLKNQYFALQNELNDSHLALEMLARALGDHNTPRTYLIAFQNPSELRATGGFWGSYMLVSLQNGKITAMDIRNIYDLDGQLAEKITPPKALQNITPTWGTRDANWFFDFPTSAQKAAEFFEASKLDTNPHRTIDGVIAVNTKLVTELLKKTGPIEMPEYNMSISSDNFMESVQNTVEFGGDNSTYGDPKRILKIFIPRFLTALSALPHKQDIFSVVMAMLDEKEIQIAMINPDLTQAAESLRTLGYDGHITASSALEDYLAFIDSNVAGGKSDYVITQKINDTIDLRSDGTASHTLIVSRAHNGDQASFALWRSTNKDYVRAYLPLNTALSYAAGLTPHTYAKTNPDTAPDPLLAASESRAVTLAGTHGLETYPEEGKKVYAGWSVLAAGEHQQITLQYSTRFLANSASPLSNAIYNLTYQKQSGVTSVLDLTINAPTGYVFKETGLDTYRTHFSIDPRELSITLTLVPSNGQ
ncbi:MAG: DUF4012 domain-containing protein [Patescibacteria group bacterium]|nr:DUF4012 domain-containing protein [Patescibacteria group bacterium]MDE2437843.1 DUF4012 domain-containing protein [Patescibacteria group bacterium]